MTFKHKLRSITLAILVLTSPVVGVLAPALGSGTASAATYNGFSYTQVANDGTVTGSVLGISCSGASCPALDNSGNSLDGDFTYRAGSKYVFEYNPGHTTSLSDALTGTACQPTITVPDAAKPGSGTYTNPCTNETASVSIGGTSLFSDFIKSGGAASVGGPVTAKLSVNFNNLDTTKTLPLNVNVALQCASTNANDAVCADSTFNNRAVGTNSTTLTASPVIYSGVFNGLTPNHKYKFCWTADFLKGGDGVLGHALCSTTFTEGTTAKTVNVDGTGDSSKLSATTSNSGDNTDPTCESSAGGFGWILCKLIDGLQNAIGGIYDHLIKPLLITEPITTTNRTGNQIYKAWSNFRIYGDVFLVIALIIIVFGESIGGGLIDAYTAKKVLPRLLVAAVLINISYYVVAILVDITNIVGNGLMTLITTPFGLTGDFTLDINRTGAATMTALLGSAIVWATVSLSGQFVAWLFFSVLLPIFLLFLSILAVVLIRRALIVFLVIISPVAFALYCLPNTEKYFKKWWDILFETLLVYPIIAALFAMGKVSGYLINQSGGTNFAIDGLANILGIVALVVPLLLVPFSFKLAGGLIGRAYDLASGARTKMALGQSSRDRIKAQAQRNRVQSREKYYSKLQEEGSKGGAFRRNTLGRAARGAGGLLGYNVQAEASAARAEEAKIINDQIATGKDDEIRGLAVNKRWALSQGQSVLQADGSWSDGQWRNNNGKRQFKTLGGAWVDEADVDRGHQRWGNNTFAQQAALSYEMRKAMDEDQLQNLATNYHNVARGPGGWGMTDDQANGAWIGAAFERQNEHLEFKSSDWKTGLLNKTKGSEGTNAAGAVVSDSGLRGQGFVEEAYQKKGSYSLAQMSANTIEQLKQAHHSADLVIRGRSESGAVVNYSPAQIAAAREQQDKIKAISETFVHDIGAGSINNVESVGDNGQPVMVSPSAAMGTGTGGARGRQVSTPGAGAVSERAYELAVLTGTIVEQPTNQNPAGSRQKSQYP